MAYHEKRSHYQDDGQGRKQCPDNQTARHFQNASITSSDQHSRARIGSTALSSVACDARNWKPLSMPGARRSNQSQHKDKTPAPHMAKAQPLLSSLEPRVIATCQCDVNHSMTIATLLKRISVGLSEHLHKREWASSQAISKPSGSAQQANRAPTIASCLRSLPSRLAHHYLLRSDPLLPQLKHQALARTSPVNPQTPAPQRSQRMSPHGRRCMCLLPEHIAGPSLRLMFPAEGQLHAPELGASVDIRPHAKNVQDHFGTVWYHGLLRRYMEQRHELVLTLWMQWRTYRSASLSAASCKPSCSPRTMIHTCHRVRRIQRRMACGKAYPAYSETSASGEDC
jgi:hypothetical protein